MVKFKRFLFLGLVLISMTSLVSGLSLADLFNNILTGKAITNKDPSVELGGPADTQVVGNPVTFTWTYFDPEDEPMVQYAIYVDDNPRFTKPFAFYGLKGDSQKIYLPLEDGQYYWRIEVRDQFGSGQSETRYFYLNNKEKLCPDGTKYYDCSINKPDYCRAGVLVKDCIRCGCGKGGTCGAGGDCTELKCSDSTLYGDCSINKPQICLTTGTLKNACSLCGCPDGSVCSSDGSCTIGPVDKPVVETNQPKEVQQSGFIGILTRIARVFKFIFTGQPL